MGCKCGGNRGARPRQVSAPPKPSAVQPPAAAAAMLPQNPSLPADANMPANNKERRRIEQLRREQIRNALGVG